MTERMTSQQVADRLRVHRATVHRWVADGKLQTADTIWLNEASADAAAVLPDPHAPKVYLFDRAYIEDLAARLT